MTDVLKFEKSGSASATRKTSKIKEAKARRYSSDEVADIIRVGLRNDNADAENTLDYDELVSIGEEVGVHREQIDRAITLIEEDQRTQEQASLHWRKFKAHCVVSGCVTALVVTINLMTGLESFWAGYFLLGLGLSLLGHYVGLRFAPQFIEMALQRTQSMAINKVNEHLEEDDNVCFKLSDPSGLMETEGLVFLDEGQLVMEYQTTDSMLGLIKSNVKEVEISLLDIRSAKLEQKFWSSQLVIHSRSFKVFNNVPGSSAGKLKLKIPRTSQAAALALVDEMSASL